MSSLSDSGVQQLLDAPNHAVISTLSPDGAVHSTVVWVSREDGAVAVNSAVGRHWPNNLERDPRITLTVYNVENPYEYVEIRGTARQGDKPDEHIDALAKKYMNADSYPFRQPGEQRVKYLVDPQRVRYVNQG